MSMIPTQSLDAVRARLNIVEVIGEYVPQLQRAGRNMKARCPFHQERTPSFIISPERQTFHCFGCGEGGDAFSFVMKMESLSFSEAVEKLAERVGVKIAPSAEALGPAEKEKLRLRELLSLAAEYYHKTLMSAGQAAEARRYMERRHVSAEALGRFKVGYAPKQGELHAKAIEKGFTREQVVKAGLAAEAKSGGGRLRDYFYDRVLYPIFDTKGAVIGFGGRTLGEGLPKYLNSPESPVFSKGRVLYGLSHGLPAIRKSRRVLLMEGYMDVIAAHQHGLVEACAPLGTALTPEHASLIKRYAGEAVIVFDADSAGLSAAIRGAEILLAEGLAVRIATVPQGKDPDEHLHEYGVESFQKCLVDAVDLVVFKMELLIKAHQAPLSARDKASVAKQVLATISQSPDQIVKAEWARRLSQRLDISESAVLKELGLATAAPDRRRPAVGAAPVETGFPESDAQILEYVFRKPALAKLVAEADLASAQARRLWRAADAALDRGASQESWSARVLESLGSEDRPAAAKLLVDDRTVDDPEKSLESILVRRRRAARLKEIEPEVLAMGGGARPVDNKLKDEYYALLAQLSGTKR
jgi:DNA primase